jgi:hypothetical protein
MTSSAKPHASRVQRALSAMNLECKLLSHALLGTIAQEAISEAFRALLGAIVPPRQPLQSPHAFLALLARSAMFGGLQSLQGCAILASCVS